MPKIKAYKANNAVIAVDEAKLCNAYRCPFTSKIYLTKPSYVKHLRALRESRMWANARERRFAARLEDLWSQRSFDDIVRWVSLNSDVFWQNGKRLGWTSDSNRWDSFRDDFFIEIVSLDLRYSDNVSNTHYCPHNGVTNWGRDEGAPRGYPGWTGSVTFKISHEVPSFFSNIFKGTRIHLGSGGGNGRTFQYSVIFFEDDWPELAAERKLQIDRYQKSNILNMIKNSYTPWVDPAIKIKKETA